MKGNRTWTLAWAGVCLALLAGCGGGGGESDPAPGGGTPASFPLRAAYNSYIVTQAQYAFDAVARMRRLGYCTGSATIVQSAPSNGSFRSAASVNSPQRISFTLSFCNGTAFDAVSSASDQILHRDVAGAILGTTDEDTISVARAPIVLPERIQVGDSGTLGTLDNLDKVSGASAGTTVISYRATADGTDGNSVLVALTLASSGPSPQDSQTDVNTYRLGANGSLRLVQYDSSADGDSVSFFAR